MRMPNRLAIAFVLCLAVTAEAEDRAGRATVLPTTDLTTVHDLTPPEFSQPLEHALEADAPVGGWYAGIEFLYMTPRERGLDFALVDPRNDLVPTGTMQSLNFKPAPGVRAAIGYKIPGRGWDIGVAYTYFAATDEFGVGAPDGALLYPSLTRAGLTNESQIAAARTRLTLNVYDVTAGRTWEFDESSRLRLFGGVRLATIRQTLEATYSGRDADAAGIDWRAQYDGAGPIFGADTWLGMGDGFGLFGRATAGMLTGTMRSPFSETNNGGATLYADLRDRYALTVPVVSLGVGISYEYRGVYLRAGYEVTNFIGLFERPAFVDDFAQGKIVRQSNNLALDGFFIQLGLSF
jgi:Legionella pneumophila major outer membrane protein precursor